MDDCCMADSEDWRRLGELVKARRGYIGHKTRKQFADATGFPAKTLSDLEQHHRENFDGSTLARLEAALRWPAGAIDAILRGTPAPSTPLADRFATPTEESAGVIVRRQGMLSEIIGAKSRHAERGADPGDAIEYHGPVDREVADLLALLDAGVLSAHDRAMLLRLVDEVRELVFRASAGGLVSGRAPEALIGSYAHGTAVRPVGDVDVVVDRRAPAEEARR